MGWVILYANEWEDYSNYFKEGARISRNQITTHFLAFYGWPLLWHGLVCHSAYANVLQWVYNKAQGLLEVQPYTILNLMHSKKVISYPQRLLLKVVLCPLPSYFISRSRWVGLKQSPLWREVTQSCLTLCNPMDCSPAKPLYPWDFPGKNTGVGCHFVLQEIFLSQGLNPVLPHCGQNLYPLSHQGNPRVLYWRKNPRFSARWKYWNCVGDNRLLLPFS